MFCLAPFCCVCFTNTTKIKNILYEDTDGISLAEKIKFCTIENEWFDDFEMFICLICHRNLKVAYEFKKNCLQTRKRLRGYIFQLQQNKHSGKDNEDAELDVSLPDIPPDTPIIDVIKIDDSDNESDYENESDYSVSSSNFEKYEEVFIKQESRENIQRAADSFDCKEIIDLTETHEDFTEDFIGFQRKTICNAVTYLSKVVITLNSEVVRFVKFSEYVRETRRVISCPICLKKFSRKTSIYTHMLIHKNKKPYTCTICKKSFRQKSNLSTHMSIHSGLTYYKCTLCEKSYYHNSHLNVHMLSHTGERPHKCTVCGRRFTTRSHLTIHMISHSDFRFKCRICSKKFAHKSSLVKHNVVHTGEKPYKCLECGKQFARKYSMMTHRFLHTGIKPHACSVCGKKYALKGDAKKHELSHSERKQYNCTECDKVYTQSGNLRRHVNKYHTDQ